LATPSNAAWLVDTTAPTTLVDTLTNDNVLNFAEREGGVAVRGVSSGAQVGDQVLVQWNGTSLTTSVQANGSWEVSFTKKQLPVGELQSDITVTITDLAGNSSVTIATVNVDTVAPVMALPEATMPSDLNGWTVDVSNAVVDNILNLFELTDINSGATWSLSGDTTAEAGQSIALELDGRIFKGSVSSGPSSEGKNTWTVTDKTDGNDVASVLAGLVHGNTYSLKVQGQDAAGNLSAWNESLLAVKLYPPDVPTVAVLKTNSLTPLISGKALKDTNLVDEYGAKIYSNLEDDDSVDRHIAQFGWSNNQQHSNLNFKSGARQQLDPLSYDRNTQEWQLDLGAFTRTAMVL
jgi:large repetitive protein